MAANALTRVPFRGGEIIVIETEDGEYVALKPICVRLGLDDRGQRKKVTSNPARWGGVILTLPSASGDQETLCLPRGKLFGWLATISPNKVAPTLRDALTAFQNEADAVLDRYFRQRRGSPMPSVRETVEITKDELIDLMRAKIALLEGRTETPRRKPRPITHGEIAEWRRLALEGVSRSAIARRFGRSGGTVSHYLSVSREEVNHG